MRVAVAHPCDKSSIEAALELTGNNRASAAEMLGLSRQSLYVKLRRFGLAEHAADEEGDHARRSEARSEIDGDHVDAQ